MLLKRFLTGTALAVTAMSAQAAELKFANFTPPFHTINASVIETLNEAVSSATGGELTVRGYHGGELGAGPAEQYVRVVQGVADMAWGLPGYTSSQFPKTMIAELPTTLTLDQPGYEALWNAYSELESEFPRTKPLALWTSEPNIFIMKDHEIRTPEDLSGLKVRVAGSTSADVAEALGATPVQMPINQVYNAMQTGLIDGVITGASTLSDFKLDEVANSYTLGANLGRLVFYTVMTQSTFDNLPEEHRAAIEEASGMPLSQSAEDAWNATADAALQAAREAGDNTIVELSEDEAQAFNDAVAEVTEAYVERVGGQAAYDAMQNAGGEGS
ncbi:TRAP transporter substrate-binding protein [Roseivivax sediminis]|uniref:TRAP-type C4-dicarboxylate transport system, substrate-binding protein n=1 Tax=Roseivivax sediminis TaxID=936889 RepID=A0A1I2D3Y8_9RHOB|nr:TRAP transporter substrate-binding protein [Roseivivax sediminis]SFE75221.1 TRAP-type C4-dicarboxylate transport system, substrate-binding protein [Roseivivax sediminis]